MKDTVKIEDLKVGEFYELYSPYGMKYDYLPYELLKITTDKLIFIDREGAPSAWRKSVFINGEVFFIKHKKPPEFPKKTMTGWATYSDGPPSSDYPYSHFPFDVFFNKEASALLFDTKEKALAIWKNAAYVKMTIELADPEEKTE